MKAIVRLLSILYVVTGFIYIVLGFSALSGGELFQEGSKLVGFLGAGNGIILLLFAVLYIGVGACAVIACNGNMKLMDLSWYLALLIFVVELCNTIYIIVDVELTSELVMKLMIPTVFTGCLFMARKDEKEFAAMRAASASKASASQKANSVKHDRKHK